MTRVEGIKSEAEKALAESRQLLAMDDAGDTNRVIQSIRDLNESVDDLAFTLFSAVKDEERSAPLSPDLKAILRSGAPFGGGSARRAIDHILQQSEQNSLLLVDHFLLQLLKAIINDHLIEHVFSKFHSAINHGATNELLSTLYNHLCKTGESFSSNFARGNLSIARRTSAPRRSLA